MDDSTKMTVEFLRARLLSERSVSRTARQRADQLAKRVVELEEHLRIVTTQRKKAERAAIAVLSILESQGIGNFSEVVDSSSEQDETPLEVKRGDDTVKEGESSATSRMDKSEVDDGYSGSEHEIVPSQGRSLSWKGSDNGPGSLEMKNNNQNRQRQRRRSFTYASESSSRHHLGRSCRKIKRREAGCTAANGKDGSISHDTKEEEARSVGIPHGFVDNCIDVPNEASNHIEDKGNKFVTCSLENQSKTSGISNNEEMEQALEQQAQFIREHQSEENSQKEWEEKFQTNNNSDVDCYDTGKMTESTEDRNEQAGETPLWANEISCCDQELNSCKTPTPNAVVIVTSDENSVGLESKRGDGSYDKMTLTISDGNATPDKSITCAAQLLNVDNDGSTDQHENKTIISYPESCSQDFEFSGQAIVCRLENDGDEVHVQLDDKTDIVSHGSSSSGLQTHVDGSHESPSGRSYSSAAHSNFRFSKEHRHDTQKQHHKQLPPIRNDGLGVLEALQRAKLSLKQELDRSTSRGQTTWASPTDSYNHAVKPREILDIPVGSAGLFRLPTDASPQIGFSRPICYNSTSISAWPCSEFDLAITANSGQRTLGLYSDTDFSKVPVGIQDFGSNITSSMALPVYTSTYPYHSSEHTTSGHIADGFQKTYTDMKTKGLCRDHWSLFGN